MRIPLVLSNSDHLRTIARVAKEVTVTEDGGFIHNPTGRVLDVYRGPGYPRVTIPISENQTGAMYVHHLMWIAHHGPEGLGGSLSIDHKNRDKRDNRLSNLRLVTATANTLNKSNNREHPYVVIRKGFHYLHGYNVRGDKRDRWYTPVSPAAAPFWSQRCVAALSQEQPFPVPHLPESVTLRTYRMGSDPSKPFELYDRGSILGTYRTPFEATVAAIDFRLGIRDSRVMKRKLKDAVTVAGSPEKLARLLLATSRHLPTLNQ